MFAVRSSFGPQQQTSLEICQIITITVLILTYLKFWILVVTDTMLFVHAYIKFYL